MKFAVITKQGDKEGFDVELDYVEAFQAVVHNDGALTFTDSKFLPEEVARYEAGEWVSLEVAS